MNLYGLTGAAGCGKSTAASFFRAFHWKTVDADALCREIHSPGHEAFHEALRKRWGDRAVLPDGSTDRAFAAEKVFQDPAEKAWLENLILPEAERRMKEMLETFPEDSFVLLDAPLLYERGWETETKAVIAVWTTPEIQMERLLSRGWTREHSEARIRAQLSADEKLERADYGIINTGAPEELREQCRFLAEHLSGRSHRI